MKRKYYSIIIAVGVLAYTAAVIGISVNVSNGSHAAAPQTELTQTNAKFVVREHDGKIAVFVSGDSTPIRFLSIHPSELREYDRLMFQRGVELETVSDVLLLEEDFSS